MQYMNDDIDELYRRAAEGYPLNTRSADWNAVAKKIIAQNPGKITGHHTGRSNNKYFLLLLLLLPAVWLGKEEAYQFKGKQTTKRNEVPVANNKLSLDPSNSTGPGNNVLPVTAPQLIAGNRLAFMEPVNKNTVVSHQENKAYEPDFTTAVNTGNAFRVPDKPIISDQATNNDLPGLAYGKISDPINENSKIDEQGNNDNATLPVKNKIKKQVRSSGIYVGIVVSPDISTVKLQAVEKTGLSTGIILGYQFNKKISVETGIAWDKKYYHSDGKYFNEKNVTLLPYATIKKLDGVCKMIEVPITVRYNLTSSAKTNLSVSTGVSSYIMKNENYAYTIERNNVQYPRKAAYNNTSSDLAAVANVGLGYNRNIGKTYAVRIEPYIKIPLKGVGIGDLPIMSTGINIGLVKKFSK